MADKAKADSAEPGRAAAELLAGLAPADALESVLVEQMAAVHEAALRATERAAESRDHPQIEALYLRQAARLMHLFLRQAANGRRPAGVPSRRRDAEQGRIAVGLPAHTGRGGRRQIRPRSPVRACESSIA